MSKSAKDRTLLLFLCRHSVGQTPDLRAASYYEAAARFYMQYAELRPEMRRNSRYLGRKIIQLMGCERLSACRRRDTIQTNLNPRR